MSNYTDLENIIEDINQSAIDTKEIIDNSIYENVEQEITAQMANNAVSEVNNMSKDNDKKLAEFLINKYTDKIKFTIVDNIFTQYYSRNRARVVQNNDYKCLVIEVPERIFINAESEDELFKKSFVGGYGSFDYDIPARIYNLAYIENSTYSTTYNGKYILYSPLNENDPEDNYYHSNNISYIWFDKTFIVIPCYSLERGWVIPNVEILNNDGTTNTILSGGNTEISDFEYEIDIPSFTYDISQDFITSENYTWNHNKSIIYNLSTHTTLNKINIGTEDDKWIPTQKDTYLITLNSLDTISFKNIFTAEYGFTVIDSIPVIDDGIQAIKMPPTAETMYLEGSGAQNQLYEYFNYIQSDISNLVITNTTSNTVYVYIDIEKFSRDSEILVNGTNILLPNSDEVILDNRKQLEDTDIEALTDNVIWLKKEIAYLYDVIFRLITSN